MFGFGKRLERVRKEIDILGGRVACLEGDVNILKNPKEVEKRYIEGLVENVSRGHNNSFINYKEYSDKEIAEMKKEIAEYYSR